MTPSPTTGQPPEPSPAAETTSTTSGSGSATPTDYLLHPQETLYVTIHLPGEEQASLIQALRCSTCRALVIDLDLHDHEAWHKRRG